MPSLRKSLVIGATVVAVVGTGTGVAIAASNNSTSPSTSSSNSAPNHTKGQHHGHRGLLSKVDHGEFTTTGTKHQVIDLQRGQVQAVSANSITVKSDDGFTATYTVDNNTKVHKDKKTATISQVKTGDKVFVVADKNGSTVTAKNLADQTK